MNRREFCCAPFALCVLQPMPKKRPNFLFILADDLGYGDLSAYGAPDCSTPNINGIGRKGVRFTRAYANAPECTPTRCAFLTGAYQQRVGGLECAIGTGNVGRYDEAEWLASRGELGLPQNERTVARILSEAGYRTCLSGKWHLGYGPRFGPNGHGFEEYFGIRSGNVNYFTHREANGDSDLYHNEARVERQGYMTDLIADHAVEWLRKNDSRPFFHYVAFTAPHSPFQGPDDGKKQITQEDWNKGERSTYTAMVQHMDVAVGRILKQLEQMHSADNTLVVFMSDNGGANLSRNAPWKGRKTTLWEGGIRVPCLARWPKVIPTGIETEQAICTMDWTRTFLSAAGVHSPGRTLDGIDLLPAIRNGRAPARTLFFRYKRAAARRWAVIDGKLKYIREGTEEGLYDLGSDPGETRNLADGQPRKVAELRSKLSKWEADVSASRLRDFTSVRARSSRPVPSRSNDIDEGPGSEPGPQTC